jgi:hypothetical protein
MAQLKTEYTMFDRIIFNDKIYPELIIVKEDEYRFRNNEYRGSMSADGTHPDFEKKYRKFSSILKNYTALSLFYVDQNENIFEFSFASYKLIIDKLANCKKKLINRSCMCHL